MLLDIPYLECFGRIVINISNWRMYFFIEHVLLLFNVLSCIPTMQWLGHEIDTLFAL